MRFNLRNDRCVYVSAAPLASGLRTRKALPVLLHPSDGFVLVELSLEFIFLQSQDRHVHAAKSGRSPEIKCGLVGFLLFFLCAASTSHCSLVSGARCRASAVAFLVKKSSSSTPASPAYALFLRTSRSGS